MHCPIYKLTMRSDNCLLYQARAAGKANTRLKNREQVPATIKLMWESKYKPCLTCETGRQVKKNGGNDNDVEKLIEKRIEKLEKSELKNLTCERCGWAGPKKSFHKIGKAGYINVCRKCIAKVRVDNKTEHSKNKVVIDFTDYKDVLIKLQEDSRDTFRTVEKEILYRVVTYFDK